MSSEWRAFQLNQTGRIVTGKTPKGGIPEYEGNDVSFVTPPDFTGNKWIAKTVRSISEIGAQSVKGSLLHPRSVLVTCIGSDMGKAAIAGARCVTNQQINAVVVDESKFCPEFLYYNLSQRKAEIRSLAGGSAQPILNKSAFGLLTFNAPALEEQKQISATLRPIDDRIALLRETNQTLEAIAQALFKSWFVDFDPVRAKVEGRLPEGVDAATAALFPDAFEESELGLVPKGWDVVSLNEYCKIFKGCSYKGAGLSDNAGAYMLNLGCFNAPRVFAFENIKRYTGEYKERHRVSAGDLIVANTDMTQVRAILGRPLIVPNGLQDSFISHHVFRLQLLNSDEPSLRNFLFFTLQQSEFRKRAIGYATGTTVLALPKEVLEGFKLTRPSNEVLAAFNEVTNPLLDSIQENEIKVNALSNLRDTLLPRLISGQLRIANAEEELEKATA